MASISPNTPRIFEVARVTSTNDEVRRMADAGEEPPFWLRADEQSAGRGRRGRTWSSAPGNLFVSGFYRLKTTPADAAKLSFAAALATAEMLDTAAELARVRLKWPNDVLLDGAKVAGVLLEARSEEPGVELVIGVGVNLASSPSDVAPRPACLADAIDGEPPSASAAARTLAQAFDRWLAVWTEEGFSRIRSEWLARAAGLGQRVEAQLADERVSGVFSDLDQDGALVIAVDGGHRIVRAGEVFFPQAHEVG